MTKSESNKERVRAQQRDLWDGVSAGWARWREEFGRGGAVASARLIELGGVRPGHRVLDVGTGIGDPALAVADAVGPAGRVLGVDIAPEMIAVARTRAAGRRNVEFVAGDAETHPLEPASFDVVVSRWSLMFAPEPTAMLTALRRALVPGGVLAAAVWGPAQTAPIVGMAFRVLSERLSFPPPQPGAPGGYSLSDPGRCLAELDAAGFVDGTVTEEQLPFWMDSPEQYARFARDILPPGVKQMLRDGYGTDDDPETWQAVARLAADRAAADGTIPLPSVALFLRATAPDGVAD